MKVEQTEKASTNKVGKYVLLKVFFKTLKR